MTRVPTRRHDAPGIAVQTGVGGPAARRPWGLVALAVLVAAALVTAAVGWRPALYRTGLLVDGGRPTVPPTFYDALPVPRGTSASPQPGRPAATPVAAASAAPSGPAPDRAALAKALGQVDATKMGKTSGMVLDARTGQLLWASDQGRNLVPASTMKVLTCAAALDALGPDHRFTTRALLDGSRLVLVGAGDPYLASKPGKDYPHPGTSAALAQQVAAALKAKGATTVSLGFDESLFSGPGWNPNWPTSYADQVSTIGALWIDQGRPSDKEPPSATPGASAATVFAAQLKAQGITVEGEPAAAKAADTAEQVGAVQSLPVSVLVQETLVHSDNSAAEVLLRHVGIAGGQGGSFTGGAKALAQRLDAMGVMAPAKGLPATTAPRLLDGSGLSRGNQVSAQLLARVLQHAAVTPRLSALHEGLPAAGVTGTLHARFYTPASEAGRGIVKAKTGTLSKVSTLAGRTRTRAGGEVVFAFMSNSPQQEWDVRSWLDQMSTTLATCRC